MAVEEGFEPSEAGPRECEFALPHRLCFKPYRISINLVKF